MYFPYLRSKQFEVEALLEAPASIYSNTLPILEPVNISRPRLYERLASQGVPLILVTNPYYPIGSTLSSTDIQSLITTQLAAHPSLLLGFIIDVRFSVTDLNSFLTSNRSLGKVLIFRNDPLPTMITAIQRAIATRPVQYIIFDDVKTNSTTRAAFVTHPSRVLLTDGFQRQDANALYPAASTFSSNYSTYNANGWLGIGDYATIGDHFQPGGGPVYVVALHVTKHMASTGLVVHHFLSVSSRNIKGLAPMKFAEANDALVSSAHVRPLRTVGIEYFRDWYTRAHNPQLGAAKKASIIHHMEVMSSLV